METRGSNKDVYTSLHITMVTVLMAAISFCVPLNKTVAYAGVAVLLGHRKTLPKVN